MPNDLTYAHIEFDETGNPFIGRTTTKVIELVLDKVAYGWGAEELHLQHPHLTLGQISSALAYYWDHQDELKADIERRMAELETVRQAMGSTPLIAKLKAQGLLP
jgi:uncharacterized protein (DUF433 family)